MPFDGIGRCGIGIHRLDLEGVDRDPAVGDGVDDTMSPSKRLPDVAAEVHTDLRQRDGTEVEHVAAGRLDVDATGVDVPRRCTEFGADRVRVELVAAPADRHVHGGASQPASS